jgi:hypothetical protein
MAHDAAPEAGRLLHRGLRRLVAMTVGERATPPSGASLSPADAAAVKALASAGLGGLVGLPFLMLASAFLQTPLAGPAAIALGYLASARALAMRRPRRAVGWSLVVAAGLLAWPLVLFAMGDPPATAPELTAVLLAPVFAAAPAFARHVLGGAKAATASVGDAAASDLGDDVAPEAHGSAGTSDPAWAIAAQEPPRAPLEPPCRVGDELGFALRNLQGRMRGRRTRIACAVEPGLSAYCEPQACRRLFGILIGCALGRSAAGGEVRVTARAVRGVALVRVSLTTEEAPDTVWSAEALAPVHEIMERTGGTAVLDRHSGAARVSVRLALAPPAMAVRAGPVRREAA